jgi:hypothetical protein
VSKAITGHISLGQKLLIIWIILTN